MNNQTLLIKLKQRLNKLDSQDFDNIQCWQFVEAFNKAQLEWCRRNLHGGNMYKEGDELSKKRIDDLQPLLIELSLTGTVTDTYFETDPYTGQISLNNVLCEFKDDLVEVMLDDTAALIAGDIENLYQQKRGQASAERNK